MTLRCFASSGWQVSRKGLGRGVGIGAHSRRLWDPLGAWLATEAKAEAQAAVAHYGTPDHLDVATILHERWLGLDDLQRAVYTKRAQSNRRALSKRQVLPRWRRPPPFLLRARPILSRPVMAPVCARTLLPRWEAKPRKNARTPSAAAAR
jgi:hypothetical protein